MELYIKDHLKQKSLSDLVCLRMRKNQIKEEKQKVLFIQILKIKPKSNNLSNMILVVEKRGFILFVGSFISSIMSH